MVHFSLRAKAPIRVTRVLTFNMTIVTVAIMDAGKRLRAFREWLGWGRAEMARALDCHPSYVGRIEDAGRDLKGLQYAQRLEALSKDWPEGPIRTEEWVTQPLPEPAPAPAAEIADDDDSNPKPSGASAA